MRNFRNWKGICGGIFAIIVFTIIGMWTSLIVSAQKEESSSEKMINNESLQDIKGLTEEQKIFGRKSSTKQETDEGFNIVAIRKVFILLNDIDAEGDQITVRKDLIEFEFYAKVLPIASALPDFIIIGDQVFPFSNGDGCEDKNHCFMVRMTPKEFDKLIDNSFVTLTKGFNFNAKELKQQYANGEPKEVVGAKFGRLDKKLIEQFQVVERKR